MVSKTPSPNRKLRSVTGTAACSSDINCPLIKTVILAGGRVAALARTLGHQEVVPTYVVRKAYADWDCKFKAAKNPRALASVSSYSAAGTESATMPAPTWK